MTSTGPNPSWLKGDDLETYLKIQDHEFREIFSKLIKKKEEELDAAKETISKVEKELDAAKGTISKVEEELDAAKGTISKVEGERDATQEKLDLQTAKKNILDCIVRLTTLKSESVKTELENLIKDVATVCAKSQLVLEYKTTAQRSNTSQIGSRTGESVGSSKVTDVKDNGFSKFRRSHLSKDFDVRSWEVNQDMLDQAVLCHFFGDDNEKKKEFLDNQQMRLNDFRSVFLYCQAQEIKIDELSFVQPIFYSFLSQFLCDLQKDVHTVKNVNRTQLSVTLPMLPEGTVKQLSGRPDIAVYPTSGESDLPSAWSHMIEMKTCFKNYIRDGNGGQAEDQLIVQLAAVQGVKLQDRSSLSSNFASLTTTSSTEPPPRNAPSSAEINVLGALTDMFELRIACAVTTQTGDNIFFLSDRVHDAELFVLSVAYLFCPPDVLFSDALKRCKSTDTMSVSGKQQTTAKISKSGTSPTPAGQNSDEKQKGGGFYRWEYAHRVENMNRDSEDTIPLYDDEDSDFLDEISALERWSARFYEELDAKKPIRIDSI